MDTIKYLLCGFGMALADSVPGVSGGTVAYLAGIYDRFIRSFGELLHGGRKERKSALVFLAKLGAGWVVGMALAVTVLANVFTSGIYQVSSLFLGLTAASIPAVIVEERKALRGKAACLPILILCAAAVAGLSAIRLGVPVEPGSWNALTPVYVFAAGMLSISAMLLPGISGSSLLFAFGLYLPIISGLKNLLHLDFGSFWLIAVFGLGVILGIFVSFRGIRFLLERHRSATVYGIIGMMLGSLYAIVRGPTTLKTPLPAVSLSTFSPWWFLAGAAAVTLLLLMKHRNLSKERH